MTMLFRIPSLFVLCTALPLDSAAQNCAIPFDLPLFGVRSEMDVPYGTAIRYNGSTAQLAMDIFKPVGDGQTERPLLILVHGGGFTSGSRADLHDLCAGLASMGYVAVTMSYRLGFYGNGILEPPYTYDPYEVVRAVYRSQQDVKGAVRFLKGRSADDSTSTSSVFLAGFSAGAIACLHAAYMDLPEEKPAVCGAIGDVQHFLNFYPRPDLGGVDGDLNLNGHDASVMGVAGFFGGLLSTDLLNGSVSPALYTYHQNGDPIVSCGHQQPYWGIGLGVPDGYPYLYGSCAIDQYVQEIGHAPGHYLHHAHAGNAHEVHDPLGVLLELSHWMRDLFCASPTDVAEARAPLLRAFPNPVQDVLQLELPDAGAWTVQVTDAQGRPVSAPRMAHGGIDVQGLAPGTYVLRALAEGHAHVTTFVVAR